MASKVGSTPNTFVNIYSTQFQWKKTGFDATSKIFLETLSNFDTSTQKTPENKKVYERIEVAKEGLQTLVNAQNDYLNNTLFGRIEKAFQSLLGWIFGEKSTVERAQGEINRINGAGFSGTSTPTSIAKSQAMLARSIAIREKATISIVLGDASNPSTILIAKPNGDVYEIPRGRVNCKGQGSQNPGARRFYEGTLHSTDGTSKQIGIITNLTTRPLDEYDTQGIVHEAGTEALNMNPQDREEHIAKAKKKLLDYNKDVLNKVAIKMEKEFEFLKGIQGDGIIKVYDNFSLEISGINACFTIVDYHPNGDLSKKQIAEDKKLGFVSHLLTSCSQLASKGILHRDLKPGNILVTEDSKSVLIDFETSIKIDDEKGKKENASTVQYMPPEYIDALLNGVYNHVDNGPHTHFLPTHLPLYPVRASALTIDAKVTQDINDILSQRDPSVDLSTFLPGATTPAMDVWSLGLVLFSVVYGVDLINHALQFEFRCAQSSELLKTQIMHNILIEELPKFKAAMNSEKEPSEDQKGQEGWKGLWCKIKGNRGMWEQVILPMLNADPSKRATMAESLDAFNRLHPHSAPSEPLISDIGP